MDDFLSDNTPTVDEERAAYENQTLAPRSTVELSTLSSPPIDASFSSLPHPAEIPRGTEISHDKSLLRRRSFWLIAGGIAVLLLVLILGVSLGVSSSRNSSSSQESINNLSLSEVADWIVSNGISSRGDVLTEGTPQNQAAKYLMTLDASQEDTGTSRQAYLQAAKYVMAVFFYSTNGDRWISSLNFMNKDNICDWTALGISINERGSFQTEVKGVLCNSDDIPEALDVGTCAIQDMTW